MKQRVYNNVDLGPGGVMHEPCIIGMPPRDMKDGECATRIGARHIIRPFTSIYAGVVIGDDFQTGHNVFIREDNIIGNDVSIGTGTILDIRNRIGNNVRIHGGCFLEDVTIEDGVFIAPCVVFTDDKYPPNPDYLDFHGGPVVRKGAVIGAHSTILPGVEIGENSLIGAGSVVTKNVPAGAVVYGNPARVVKNVEDLGLSR